MSPGLPGGGIAGIQTALDLADSGFSVYLAEKSAGIHLRLSPSDPKRKQFREVANGADYDDTVQ